MRKTLGLYIKQTIKEDQLRSTVDDDRLFGAVVCHPVDSLQQGLVVNGDVRVVQLDSLVVVRLRDLQVGSKDVLGISKQKHVHRRLLVNDLQFN